MHTPRWISTTLAAAALLSALTAGADERRLTAGEVARDVALAEASLAHLHAGYTRYAKADDLSRAWAAIVHAAADGMRDADFYVEVSRVLAAIRCNHTKAELSESLAAERRVTPAYLPFRWQLVGPARRGIVTVPVPGTGIEPGDELLAVDGVPLTELVARYAPYVPVDGFNDHARWTELAFSAEFPGGAIEHFGALAGDADAIATVTLAANGRERVLTVPRLTGTEWRAHLAATGSFYRDFVDSVTLEFPARGTALLRVATFVNYRRPVDPGALYDPLFRKLAERDIETLIVDLRGNGGGSDDAQIALLHRLVTTPTRLFRDVTAAASTFGPAAGHVSSWDARAMAMRDADYTPLPDGRFRVNPAWVGPGLELMQPHPLGFRGHLIVLIDASLSSGSNHLVSRLAERPQLTLVGQPGGGSAAGVTAGVLYTLTLPESGIRIRIPAWQQWIDRPLPDDGSGVLPDVRVDTSVDAFRRGEDPVLAAALDIAASGQRDPVAGLE